MQKRKDSRVRRRPWPMAGMSRDSSITAGFSSAPADYPARPTPNTRPNHHTSRAAFVPGRGCQGAAGALGERAPQLCCATRRWARPRGVDWGVGAPGRSPPIASTAAAASAGLGVRLATWPHPYPTCPKYRFQEARRGRSPATEKHKRTSVYCCVPPSSEEGARHTPHRGRARTVIDAQGGHVRRGPSWKRGNPIPFVMEPLWPPAAAERHRPPCRPGNHLHLLPRLADPDRK